MIMSKSRTFTLFFGLFILCVSAQNPIIRNQFSADPSARVFNNRVYLYPSHDILASEGKGRKDWFCMEDYHVFSSDNLIDWTDHGMIVHQNKVPWVRPESYSMWAPDCIEKDGKYYFYFPSTVNDTLTNERGFTIGVAIASSPTGPFIPEKMPIKGVKGIDPNVFIDKDGQAYLYWSQGNIYGAKLKDNMLELDSEIKILDDLPSQGLKEGPYVFERNGIYYMTYPHVANKIERLEYAISDNPLGPFKVAGVIMDESSTNCWTNHHSIIEFKNQWYLFYHHNDYSPSFDKARSVRIDSLFFNSDGTIKKVIPTFRGVGITKATTEIQIDRYSKKSDVGSNISFLDPKNTFKGWKTTLSSSNAWIEYDQVDFGKNKAKTCVVKAYSTTGGTLHIKSNTIDGALITEVKIKAKPDWQEIEVPIIKQLTAIHDLFVTLKENDKNVELDWIRFK